MEYQVSMEYSEGGSVNWGAKIGDRGEVAIRD